MRLLLNFQTIILVYAQKCTGKKISYNGEEVDIVIQNSLS